ncbi:MAG: DUF2119 family protein [Methanomicrobia archaeon]|nr:DUF2119 family protein [Methanomicrobia archaeon]
MFEPQTVFGVRLYAARGSVSGPTRLVIGGLHGDEGLFTTPFIERLATAELTAGDAILVPSLVADGRYIGVLSEEYYKSAAGKLLLRLIHRYRPSFYFELHAYGQQSYERLTDPERVHKIGVPHFIELGNGILIGSIAPLLRRRFTSEDFCMTIEIPKWTSEDELVSESVLELLRIALASRDRAALMQTYRARYPTQVKHAEELFNRYYRHFLKPF